MARQRPPLRRREVVEEHTDPPHEIRELGGAAERSRGAGGAFCLRLFRGGRRLGGSGVLRRSVVVVSVRHVENHLSSSLSDIIQ